METHALSACLLRALIAHLGNMSNRQCPAVLIVQQAHTRRTKDQSACCVVSTHILRLLVSTFLPVSAMLAGREKTVTAQAVCLVNIKTALGLLRALIVERGNILTRQHPAVLIVTQTRT